MPAPHTRARRTRAPHAAALLLLVGLAPLAPAEPPRPITDQRAALSTPLADNAALRYNRYLLLLAATDLPDAVATFDLDDPAWTPDPDLAARLDEQQFSIRGLIGASRLGPCDFGVEYEDGINTLLPHLGPMRTAARVLAADARRLAAEHRYDEALDRVEAIHRMSAHLTGDRVLISSLVSMAVSGLAAQETRRLAPDLTIAQRDALARLLRARLDDPDPFAARRSITDERDLWIGWIVRTYTGPDAPAQPGAALADLLEPTMSGPDTARAFAALRDMSPEEFAADLRKAHEFYDRVDAIWTQPDFPTRFASMEKVIASGASGQILALFAPSFGRVYDANARTLASLREALDTLTR